MAKNQRIRPDSDPHPWYKLNAQYLRQFLVLHRDLVAREQYTLDDVTSNQAQVVSIEIKSDLLCLNFFGHSIMYLT